MSDVLEIGDSPEDGQTLPCPKCGRPLGPFVTDCPDCKARIVDTDGDSLSRGQKSPIGLGLLLIIGGIAIVFALSRLSTWIAIVASFVIFVALVRTLTTLDWATDLKVSPSARDVVSLIAMSLGISLVIVVSTTIVFLAACFATNFAATAVFDDIAWANAWVAGTTIGAISATIVARKIVKLLWTTGTPSKLLGIHYLDCFEETSEQRPASGPSPGKPEPPQ